MFSYVGNASRNLSTSLQNINDSKETESNENDNGVLFNPAISGRQNLSDTKMCSK